MPLRLIVDDGDRRLSFPLEDGEHLVGSCDECDIRLGHPTVSRRHVRISVRGEEAEIEDLGSSNGTRLDGESLDEPRTATFGTSLKLGSLPARLEPLESDDVVPGVLFESGVSPRETEETRAGTTASLGSLQGFALGHLPAAVSRLLADAPVGEVAQALGAGLFDSLPSTFVEIEVSGGEGLLFTAEIPGGREETTESVEVERRRLAVRAGFAHRRHASTFRPLVEAAAGLAELAGSGLRPRTEPDEVADLSPPDPPSIVPTVQRLYNEAARVARGEVSVLVSGESGVGKEVFARYVHRASPRHEGPFVALNCAALPRDLLESELFGIEKGVATGVESRPGKFELADGGTLFLDEIGDMALETQARILRVLQEDEVYRVGSHEARSADVRIVAATNRNVDAMLADGSFRLDLYHRIADWRVEIPPLRERKPDIPNLAAHFLLTAADERGVEIAGISRAAVDRLLAYEWPGNVRQLEREMARVALFLEGGEMLQSHHLQESIREAGRGPAVTLKEQLEEHERQIVRRALSSTGGNVTEAAEVLGVSRSTLYRRLGELDLRTE